MQHNNIKIIKGTCKWTDWYKSKVKQHNKQLLIIINKINPKAEMLVIKIAKKADPSSLNKNVFQTNISSKVLP